jgi:hypothetical protein
MLRIAVPAAPPAGRGLALPRRWTREQVVSTLLMLAVAAAVRLPAPDLTPFGHDEALEAARARPIWYGARPVDSEITSWWIPDPAGLLYFFALAEAFPRPAIARVELVALANVLAVLACYGLARRFFGPAVGLGAGLLYAANPWAATFARQPWVITQPLLTVAMLFSALMVVAGRDRRWIVPFFVAFAAQTQTHLLAVLYGPPVALTLLLFPRRWLGRELLVGCAAALLIVAPFAWHLWELRDAVGEALARGNRGLTLLPDATPARLTLWFVSGYNLDAKLGFPAPALAWLRGPLLAIAAFGGGLLLLGIARSGRVCLGRRPGWEAHALLLIWFLAPLTLMSWQSSAVYIHYVLVLLPTPFILMTLGLDRVRALPVAAIAAICAVQVAALGLFYAALEGSLAAPRAALTPTEWQAALNRAELDARQVGIGEIHGLPLRYWQSVADRAKGAAAGLGPAELGRDVVAITGIRDDANRQLDERRKALDYLLGPELQARFPLEGLTVLPSTRDTLFLTIPEQDLPGAARGASRLADLPLPGTNGTTRLWLVRARPPRELVRPRRPADVRFETGVRLLGLDAPPEAVPGQTVPLISYWLVERDVPAADEDDEPFLELLDGAGASRAYQAGGGLPSRQWRAGDVLAQRASLTMPVDLPPGEYRVAAGLTMREEGARARVLGPNAPAGDSVPVATVVIR